MYACISVQYGGDVGLAITQATGLTGMLQWGIRQMAEMENQMTSVERVLEYTAVESEPPLDSAPGKMHCLDNNSHHVSLTGEMVVNTDLESMWKEATMP